MFITLPAEPGVSVLTVIPGSDTDYYSNRLLHINLLILLLVHCTLSFNPNYFQYVKKTKSYLSYKSAPLPTAITALSFGLS